jgi:hypothetical protein
LALMIASQGPIVYQNTYTKGRARTALATGDNAAGLHSAAIGKSPGRINHAKAQSRQAAKIRGVSFPLPQAVAQRLCSHRVLVALIVSRFPVALPVRENLAFHVMTYANARPRYQEHRQSYQRHRLRQPRESHLIRVMHEYRGV